MAADNFFEKMYKDVVQKTLLPEGKKLFSANGQSAWIFQQDNDPTHRGGHKWAKEWMERSGCNIKTLEWPPNSPDISPIENIWGIVDAIDSAAECRQGGAPALKSSRKLCWRSSWLSLRAP